MTESTSRAPLIGITMYGAEQGRYSLPIEYVQSVRQAGGVPLLLAPGETHRERWLETLDGVILGGGGDLAPATFGGQKHASIYGVDAERDATEIAFTRELVQSPMPVFCICRGLQVLNVALGGTLIEHLDPSSVLHRAPPREPVKHSVTITPNTLLADLSGSLEVEAFSWHHQAIRELGDDLEVIARAADGVVEAIRHRTHPWLLAVQWHPELSAADSPPQQQLFDGLVRRASAARA